MRGYNGGGSALQCSTGTRYPNYLRQRYNWYRMAIPEAEWHCADNGLDGLFHPTCGSGAGNVDLDAAIRLICLLHGSVSHHAL